MYMVKRGVAVGLAAGLLLLLGVLVSPASAGLISETEIDAPHWGWASIYGEDGDDDVAAYLLLGFGIALLWPDGHDWQPSPPPPPPPPPPPVDPPSGGSTGDKVPEVSSLGLFALGLVGLLALRRRQK